MKVGKRERAIGGLASCFVSGLPHVGLPGGSSAVWDNAVGTKNLCPSKTLVLSSSDLTSQDCIHCHKGTLSSALVAFLIVMSLQSG
jgi:hypothetical protein